MARYTSPAAVQAAIDTLTVMDPNTDQAQVRVPAVDIIRGIPVVRDGLFATALDQADPTKGATLGYAKYGWTHFADRKALSKAVKNAKATWFAPVPTRSFGWAEGMAVQFQEADAFNYGVDLTQVVDEDGVLHQGVMLFTFPAYFAALSGGDVLPSLATPASDRVRETEALSSVDVIEGVAKIRAGSTRTLPARRAQDGTMLPALVVPAVDGGEVFSAGTAKAKVEAPNPYESFKGATVVPTAAPEPVAQANRYARGLQNFGGQRRRFRN